MLWKTSQFKSAFHKASCDHRIGRGPGDGRQTGEGLAIVALSGTSGPITKKNCLAGPRVNRGFYGTPEVHR